LSLYLQLADARKNIGFFYSGKASSILERFFLALPTLLKKVADQPPTFICKHAVTVLNRMVETRSIQQMELTAYGSRLRFQRAEHEALYACMNQRPYTHRARFNSHIQCGFRQTIVAESERGITQGNDFSMRGWIMTADGLIASLADDFIAQHQHGTDRNFTLRRSVLRCGKGLGHPIFIAF
jgi:hypothetical protein